MSVWTGLKRLLTKAREEATDAAQIAKMRLDIRSLESRREHLFRAIGRKVYEARNDNTQFTGIEPLCTEIDAIMRQVDRRRADLETVRGGSGSGAGMAGAHTP